jgi:hypothetical protein
MEIYNDPNNIQKRFEGKISGFKGMGYAEVFPNKKLEEFLKKIKSYVINLQRKNREIYL